MRQTRRTGRTPSTGGTGRGRFRFDDQPARPADPRAALVQGWDELLRLAPADMGLSAALGESSDPTGSDPIGWLSTFAGIPRAELDHVRKVRNSLAANRSVPEPDIARARETLDRALAVVGHMRLPE